MKRISMLLAAGLAASVLCACATSTTSTTPLTPEQRLQAAATTIDTNCTIGAPIVTNLIAVQTDPGAVSLLTGFEQKADQVCAVAASIAHPAAGATVPTLDLPGIEAYLQAQTPALLALVKNSNLDQTKKTAASLAITAVTLAVTMANLQQ